MDISYINVCGTFYYLVWVRWLRLAIDRPITLTILNFAAAQVWQDAPLQFRLLLPAIRVG